jgi:hypothetical protein
MNAYKVLVQKSERNRETIRKIVTCGWIIMLHTPVATQQTVNKAPIALH